MGLGPIDLAHGSGRGLKALCLVRPLVLTFLLGLLTDLGIFLFCLVLIIGDSIEYISVN